MIDRHSPGPWVLEGEFIYAENPTVRIADTTIADGDEDLLSEGTANANAVLMRSAPDMLDALRKIEAHLCLYQGPDPAVQAVALKHVRAVIAKATTI